eukprot:9503506-Pyramimonas_sp.AAC.1
MPSIRTSALLTLIPPLSASSRAEHGMIHVEHYVNEYLPAARFCEKEHKRADPRDSHADWVQ